MNQLDRDIRNFYITAGFVAGWLLGLIGGLFLGANLS